MTRTRSNAEGEFGLREEYPFRATWLSTVNHPEKNDLFLDATDCCPLAKKPARSWQVARSLILLPFCPFQ
jgi:hypothetical protein